MAKPERKPLNLNLEDPPKATAKPSANEDGRKFISARIPKSLFKELGIYAKHKEMKQQDVITNAITEYMANHPA